jgi:5,10-methylenetetrahydromethanopterin reductase
MDIGITLPSRADSWKTAKRAEELGFSHAWFYDTALINAEIFVAMGAAAMATARIKLCTGVLTPSNRLSPVAASGLGALNALAPGRVLFGIGTGFTGRRTMGLGPVKLQDLESYIRAVEDLLKGKTIAHTMEGETHPTRFLNPDVSGINLNDPIPTHVSAFGPKGRQLTAKLGAGWIGSASEPHGESNALADFRAAWKTNGHAANALYTTLVGGGCILKPGESADSPRALAQAGPFAAVAFHSLAEAEEYGDGLANGSFPFQAELDAYRKVYQSYPAEGRYLHNHQAHVMYVRPDEKHLTDRAVRALTLTGERDHIVERLRGMEAAGYSQFAVGIPPNDEMNMLEEWADAAARI